MKQLVRRLSGMTGNLFPFEWVRNLSGDLFIFPFYHIVSDDPGPHVTNLYPVCTIEGFRKDLGFLLQYYRPLTWSQVIKYASGIAKKDDKPGFYLTFDDGLRECAEIIAPILIEKGIEAAFFINPEFIGNQALFFRHKISLIMDRLRPESEPAVLTKAAAVMNCLPGEVIKRISLAGIGDFRLIDALAEILSIDFNTFLAERKPYLEIQQLLGMKKNGFIIGSHSFDHPLFSEMNEFQMKDQVIRSFDWLKRKIDTNVRTFSFPFTDDRVPASFFDWMYREAEIDVSFGTAGLKHEKFGRHLQRIPMENRRNSPARQILGEEYIYYFVRSIFGKNIITRR